MNIKDIMEEILNRLHETIQTLQNKNLNNNGRFILTDGRPGTKEFQVELQALSGHWFRVKQNNGDGIADLITHIVEAEVKYRELNGYRGYEKND